MEHQPSELLQTLEAFIRAETWDESRRVLDAHPEILSEHADAALSQLSSQQTTEASRVRSERSRSLLQRCREVGPDRAFAELTGAVDAPPEYHDEIRRVQAAEALYQRTGDLAALEEAIAAWERIQRDAGFPASPERFRVAMQNNAGNTFLARYSAKGDLDDLDQALALWRTSLPLIPAGSPDRPRSLISLSTGLYSRYQDLGDPADLEQAIAICRDAMQEARPYSLELPACLCNLGKCLRERHARYGRAEDLEESIRVLETARAQSDSRSPFWLAILSDLGSALMARYYTAGDSQNLERAIEMFHSAVESATANEREPARHLSNLGSALNERYNAFGDPADLETAVGCLQNAVKATPPASPDMPGYLTGLGLALGARFDHAGRPEDLEGATQAFRQAVASTSPSSPDLVGRLNNLGGQMRVRYAHTGASNDLEEALQCFRDAIRLAPTDSPDLPGSYTNLGTGLRDRYALTGELKDLDEMIAAFRRVGQTIPPRSPNFPLYLNNLGVGLSLRYDRIGQLEDLNECLKIFARAVSSTDARSPDLPMYLNNLGMGLLSRHLHTESGEHLDEAIDAFQRAVDGTPRKSPDRAAYLNNLAVALQNRYQATHQHEDLRTAVRHCRQVVRLTPVGAPDLSPRLNNLGNVLWDRYSRSGRRADLEEAISAYRQAILHSATGSPELPKHLNNLAVGLQARYLRTGEASDLEEAVSAFEQSCRRGIEVGLEEVLRTARRWGDWASERSAWQEAAHAYRYGLEAVDRLLRAQLLRQAKEAWLRQAQQYPARLAYSLARAGDGPAAIAALEASRTRLLGEALEQNRRELKQLPGLGHSALYDRYRQAAERFQALQTGFEPRGQGAGLIPGGPPFSVGADRQAPEAVRAELDAAIDAIRTVPGYHDFYRSPSFERIQQAVPSHSVLVYLVAAPWGGLALVLPASDRTSDHRPSECVERVWLDTLTDAVAAEILVSFLNPYFRWQNEQSEPVTKAWYAALQATSASLGEALAPLVPQIAVWRSSTTRSKPHHEATLSIILVPTGFLGLLPLHAVSWQANGERRLLLDEVILAYAPSAQALASAQSHVGEPTRQGDRLLAFANPTGDLPFASIEGEELRGCFGANQAHVLENGAATREALLIGSGDSNYLHFACHGSYKPLDVLRSGLALAGESPLELWEILGNSFDLSSTRLVTLSACETGMTEVQKVPEESVGLPAGFLQAGAPAVVSSLWEVNDFSTSMLMGEFYRRHRSERQGIAEALRGAQFWLRDLTRNQVLDRIEPLRARVQSADPALFRALDGLYWRLLQDTTRMIARLPIPTTGERLPPLEPPSEKEVAVSLDFSTSMLMGEFYRRHQSEGQSIAEALRRAKLWLRGLTSNQTLDRTERVQSEDSVLFRALTGVRLPLSEPSFAEEVAVSQELPITRDFVILPDTISIAEARQRVPPRFYAVIVDSQGVPYGCLYELARTTKGWPDNQPLAVLRERWQCPTLPEADVIGLTEVARFLRDKLPGTAGVVLLDQEGRPSAVLPRGKLEHALAGSRRAPAMGDGPGETGTKEAAGERREITVTGHTLDGVAVTRFRKGETYRLRFRVDAPTAENLAAGDAAVEHVPEGGLNTRWVVTSANVEFVPGLTLCKAEKVGSTWRAEFDLLIPETGSSATNEVAVLGPNGLGDLLVTIYTVAIGGHRELYRELTVSLAGAPAVRADEISKAPQHTHLRTTHEWTTPPEHIQASLKNGVADVSTKRHRLEIYEFVEPFAATDTLLKGAIYNVRDSLEKLRELHEAYLEDLDHEDMRARLSGGVWQPHYANVNGWQPLPDQADPAHRNAFTAVRHSAAWQALASNGYGLFNRCFPQSTKLRALIDKLLPGSRIDFHWSQQSGAGWVSHVPWALMYMEPVDVTGKTTPEPEKFLGLRFRIGARSWSVNNGSVVLGGLDQAQAMNILYWGRNPTDDVGLEAQWQAQEYGALCLSRLLPDAAAPDLKRQIILALDEPGPSPVAVIYFYCHCSVGDGAQPCLRFGSTSRREDTLAHTDLSQRNIPDGPLIFANACSTAQADAHMTSELEQRFFERGVRAFIGTETKVPIRLASKFAWLYFQFFYRRVDAAPLPAGEALTQARMFLWTQYQNVGGLFYSLSNQYDLYLASQEEVLSLR